MYFWRVYRRRLCYIKTKLDEAENTIYITGADDQSHADNVGQTDTGISTYTAFHDQWPTSYDNRVWQQVLRLN